MSRPPMVNELADEAFQVPRSLAVGIALTTDPQMTRGLLEQFCLALSDATGIEVIPRGVSSYRLLMENVKAGAVDIVWLPPILALSAQNAQQVTPFALPLRGGASSYHAALFTSMDTNLKALDDLVDVRAAWVDPRSAAGYLIVRAHLAQQGFDLDQAFAENMFLGSHDAVTAAVLKGRADVGATFAYLDDDGRPVRAGWGHAAIRVLHKAGPIPSDVLAARVGLSTLLVRLLQSALIDVQNAQLRQTARALLSAEGFCVPAPEHLAPLQSLLAAIKEQAAQHTSASEHPPLSIHPPISYRPLSSGAGATLVADAPDSTDTAVAPTSSARIGAPVSTPMTFAKTIVSDERPVAKTIISEPPPESLAPQESPAPQQSPAPQENRAPSKDGGTS